MGVRYMGFGVVVLRHLLGSVRAVIIFSRYLSFGVASLN